MINDFMIIRDEVFMVEHDTSAYELSGEPSTVNIITKYDDRKEVILQKNVDLRSEENILNQQLYEMAKDVLIDTGAERIKTLKNKYMAFIEFEIREEDDSLACGGIKIEDVEVVDIIQLVDISETNELHTVKQKCFKVKSTIPVTRKKLGIMFRNPGKDLTVVLKNVKIVGDISTEDDTFNQYFFNHNTGVTFTPLSKTPDLMCDETVVIYDSCIHGGLNSQPESEIDGGTKNVIFNFDIYTDGIFEVHDVSELMDIIKNNIITGKSDDVIDLIPLEPSIPKEPDPDEPDEPEDTGDVIDLIPLEPSTPIVTEPDEEIEVVDPEVEEDEEVPEL